MWLVLSDSQAPGTQRQRRGEHRVRGEGREGAVGLLLISPPRLISALINLCAVCKWSRQSKANEEVPEPLFPNSPSSHAMAWMCPSSQGCRALLSIPRPVTWRPAWPGHLQRVTFREGGGFVLKEKEKQQQQRKKSQYFPTWP